MKQRVSMNLLVFGLGLGLLSAGAYLVFPPAGLIAPGLVLMAIAVFGEQK